MSNIEWRVPVPDDMVAELKASFDAGPMLDAQGTRSLNEELVARVDGLKIEIFANEHPPPHFRVKHAGDTANFSIKDCAQLNGGLKMWKRNIEAWHKANKSALIEVWNRTRPSDCPVGKYRE